MWTASRFSCGSGGMPLGTAQDASTPSCSSRRSQCSRVAWCSWITNRGASAAGAPAARRPAPAWRRSPACGGRCRAARRAMDALDSAPAVTLRPVLLATWNVNSLKVRLPRVLEFLELHRPDVVCLQETKPRPRRFRSPSSRAAGYTAVHHSGGRWAGVAILARDGPRVSPSRAAGCPASPTPPRPAGARRAPAGCGSRASTSRTAARSTAPSTRASSPSSTRWSRASQRAAAAGEPLLIAGDFNIAPADIDVYDPPAFVGGTHVSAPERERLAQMLDAGSARRLPPPAPGRGRLHVVGLPPGPLPPQARAADRSRGWFRPRSPPAWSAAASTATSARARSPPITRRCCSSCPSPSSPTLSRSRQNSLRWPRFWWSMTSPRCSGRWNAR